MSCNLFELFVRYELSLLRKKCFFFFLKAHNVLPHFLCQVAPYERPALSKGFLLPEGMYSHYRTL